jgi:flavin reductase (DIM6/NTAB) family NADH-FMN oxidoreductase RutF
MFYVTSERDRKKLPHDPFKTIVARRPIGWISTRSLYGRLNLAPYSFFNGFASFPPTVGHSQHSLR